MANYGWRDKAVSWLANQILRLASRRYQNMVKGSIKYGLLSAARDERTGALPPLPESCYAPGAVPLTTANIPNRQEG